MRAVPLAAMRYASHAWPNAACARREADFRIRNGCFSMLDVGRRCGNGERVDVYCYGYQFHDSGSNPTIPKQNYSGKQDRNVALQRNPPKMARLDGCNSAA